MRSFWEALIHARCGVLHGCRDTLFTPIRTTAVGTCCSRGSSADEKSKVLLRALLLLWKPCSCNFATLSTAKATFSVYFVGAYHLLIQAFLVVFLPAFSHEDTNFIKNVQRNGNEYLCYHIGGRKDAG